MNFTGISQFFRVYLRITQTYFQMLAGYWRVSRLPEPVVSIFGGSRLKPTDPYYLKATDLTSLLVKANFSVLTGGGPGIMRAVSCAVPHKNGVGRSMGIGVTELDETHNTCVQKYIEVRYFFARKWLLTRHSVGFVVFPGGYGTLDEFAEILTLMQTNKMPRYPLILVGVEYWTPLVDWITKQAVKHGVVTPDELNLFILSDDLDNILCTLQKTCGTTNQTQH